MGAAESKDENKKYELFSEEEGRALQANFIRMSGSPQKADRKSIEVRISI